MMLVSIKYTLTNETEWSSSIKRDIYNNLHTAKRLTSNDVGQKWKAVRKRMKVDDHLLPVQSSTTKGSNGSRALKYDLIPNQRKKGRKYA